MNIGAGACGTLCVFFILFALLFTVMKGNAAKFISGFSSKSKEERNLYDLEKLSKDQRDAFLLWSLILGIGAIVSYFISQYLAIISIVIWLIVFFKDVHLDDEKAFGKYKK